MSSAFKERQSFHAILFFVMSVWGTETHSQITVAAASSLEPVMRRLAEEFTGQTGIKISTVYGASGKLATQIKHGAPYHVFVSADMDYPDSVYKWGVAERSPRPYGYGKLILWTFANLDSGRGMQVLTDPKVRKIALADPDIAPYGRAAVQVLKQSGLYENVHSSLIYGQNVGQVNQYIVNRSVEIGVTAKSSVMSRSMEGKGMWIDVDTTLYEPIAQGAVLCKHGMNHSPAASAHFLRYLYSGRAGYILRQYGYDVR